MVKHFPQENPDVPEPGDQVVATELRPETVSEHIARDMAEGRFPTRSERQMVAPPSPDHDIVRRQVLEEAAQLAEDYPRSFKNRGDGYIDVFPPTPAEIAAAIRQLSPGRGGA